MGASSVLARMWSWHRPLMAFAAVMAVLAAAAFVGLLVDDRFLVGAPLWAKPFKFAVSFVVYSVTWAWLLSLQTRWRRLGWWLGTVVAVAGSVEMLIIVGQQLRERRSHFNVLTAADGTLWSIMGATIAVLFVAALVWTALLWRQPLAEQAIAHALRIGAVVSLVGLGLGFLMTSPTAAQRAAMERGEATLVGAHSVGVDDGGPGLPLLGWSTTGGDLRIPHFVGMHALQLLPLTAAALVLLARYAPALTEQAVRVRLVWIFGAGYFGLLMVLTWQALRGQPVIHPDSRTLAALGALAAAVSLSTLVAVRRPARAPNAPIYETVGGTR
jgi:hypothetical protein